MHRLALAAAVAASACDGLFGLQQVPPFMSDAAIDSRQCVTTASEVRASAGQTCVVRSDGEVSCWGDNTLNQVGTLTGSTSCMVFSTEFRCTPRPASPTLPSVCTSG